MTDLAALDPYLPDIRMRLHLDRLPASRGHTSRVLLSERQALGSMFSAYRRVGRKVETALDNPFSKPMTVRHIAESLDAFSPANRAAFLQYVQLLEHSKAPRWVLPVYDLGMDGMFLMDGNHRAVALYMSDKPFEVELLVLHAPVDRRILIALKYWDGGLARLWQRR
ncbi:hypothetical protein [Devosia aurantiaca]|uniref:ParB/Sulfiredoxin domain-containing protein n=1 Tax=Devosia aurantiaca TaxID=2714858 RepID=A0A6M1SKL1_9HYPH|nr:hypothetical protein [Devosia aurantiaca]NGP17758.1 hypothetical protein [Devosia aurantiaca]